MEGIDLSWVKLGMNTVWDIEKMEIEHKHQPSPFTSDGLTFEVSENFLVNSRMKN